jgi:hypothetical protein
VQQRSVRRATKVYRGTVEEISIHRVESCEHTDYGYLKSGRRGEGIFGPQGVEATAGWRKTANETLLGRTNQCVCDGRGI